jgi:hypothetical protein
MCERKKVALAPYIGVILGRFVDSRMTPIFGTSTISNPNINRVNNLDPNHYANPDLFGCSCIEKGLIFV